MQVHIERTLTDNRTWRDGGKIWKTDYGFNDVEAEDKSDMARTLCVTYLPDKDMIQKSE